MNSIKDKRMAYYGLGNNKTTNKYNNIKDKRMAYYGITPALQTNTTTNKLQVSNTPTSKLPTQEKKTNELYGPFLPGQTTYKNLTPYSKLTNNEKDAVKQAIESKGLNTDNLGKTLPTAVSKLTTTKSAPWQSKSTSNLREVDRVNTLQNIEEGWQKVGDTGLHLGAEAVTGLAKGAEGITDFLKATSKYAPVLQLPRSEKQEEELMQSVAKNTVKEIGDKTGLSKWKEEVRNNSYAKDTIFENVSRGVGNMSTYMFAGPLSTPTMFMNVAGSSMEQALNDGATYEQAQLYGVASGIVSTAIEKISEPLLGTTIGGLGKISKNTPVGKLTDYASEKLGKIINNSTVSKALTEKIAKVGMEVVEEEIETAISPIVDKIYKEGPIEWATAQEYVDTALETALTTLVIDTANDAYNNIVEKNIASQNNLVQEDAIPQNNLQQQNIKPQNEAIKPSLEQENVNTLPTKAQQDLQVNIDEMLVKGYKVSDEVKNTLNNIAKNRGVNVVFDDTITSDGVYTNNNGARTIRLNPNSTRPIEFVAAHELMHDLEGTNEFNELVNFVQDYTKGKAEYENSRKSLERTYKKFYKDNGIDLSGLNMDIETTNDVIAKSLGNQEFLNSLAQTKPNVFQKIYNWIKETGTKLFGSEEAKFLQGLKKRVETAYNSAYNGNEYSRYSIAGKKGMENAIKNNSSNIKLRDYYNMAQDMAKQGADNELIRKTTNWFQDKTGAWKFEFSDKDMALKDNIKIQKNKAYKLRDILEHNTLFNLYPQLKNYKVTFKDMRENIKGSFNKIDNTIRVNAKNGTKTNIEGTLIHEIQHAIQEIEKFEGGTSFFSKKAYYESLGEIEAKDTKDRFIKEKEGKLDRDINPPKTSQANYENKRLDNYLKNRSILDKTKDNVYNFLNGKGNDYYDKVVEGNTLKTQRRDNTLVDGRRRHIVKKELEQSSSFSLGEIGNLKQKQLEIIQKNNSAQDDYHTWIRDIEDVKTFEETLQDSDWIGEEKFDPDYTMNMAKKALKTGKITVYSSYPIKDGVFVTPSKMEAQSYSGDGKTYSKIVNLKDVAWIDPTQGQYAKVSSNQYSQPNTKWQKFLDDNFDLMPNATRTHIEKVTPTKADRGNTINTIPANTLPTVNNSLNKISIKNNSTYENDKPLYFRFDAEGGFKGKEHQSGVPYWEDNAIDIINGEKRANSINQNYLNELQTKYEQTDNEQEKQNILREIALEEGTLTNGASAFSLSLEGIEEAEKYSENHPILDYDEANFFTGSKNKYGADGENVVIPDNDNSIKITTSEITEILDNEDFSTQEKYNKINELIQAKQLQNTLPTKADMKKITHTKPLPTKADKQVVDVKPTKPLPTKADMEGKKVRSWSNTTKGNELVLQETKSKNIDLQDLEYVPIQNKQTIEYANKIIDNQGYDNSLSEFKAIVNSNKKVTVDDIAIGERLIEEAIKKKDFRTAEELIEDVAVIGTEIGQAVQALSIIKKLTPAGQLSILNKTIKRINKAEAKINKKFKNLELSDNAKADILSQTTEQGLNDAMDRAKLELAKQMPVSVTDKLNEWRYLSMLGNPRTHIRNIVSNVAMKGTKGIKDVIARATEDLVGKGLNERTKTLKKATDEVKSFAQDTAIDMQDIITGNKKHSMESEIKGLRTIYKNGILEGARNGNSNLLEMEDWWFSKPAFENALSSYLTANGIKTKADIESSSNKKLIEKAKQYAVGEAQKATFRQVNQFASKVNELENSKIYGKLIVGGILPFKKTPANIAVTGAKYSPLGLIETLSVETTKLAKGKITANQFIDRLSEGLTGTGLTLLGMWLANMGLITAGTGGDKEDEYKEDIGQIKPYSIKIGNANYDLSWLSPSAMPVFIGVELMNMLNTENELDWKDIGEALSKTIDPLSEMSLLQGINDTLKTYDNSNSATGILSGIAKNSLKNYLSQYVPTLGSQINKIIDPVIRTSRGEGKGLSKQVDGFIRQQKNKIPGMSSQNEPAIDVWGREKQQLGNAASRAFHAMINPGQTTVDLATKVDQEIQKLYNVNGNTDIIPSIPNSYFTQDNVKYNLNAKEYTQFKKVYGQYAYENIKDFLNSSGYSQYNTSGKEKRIKGIYDEALKEAKANYFNNKK